MSQKLSLFLDGILLSPTLKILTGTSQKTTIHPSNVKTCWSVSSGARAWGKESKGSDGIWNADVSLQQPESPRFTQGRVHWKNTMGAEVDCMCLRFPWKISPIRSTQSRYSPTTQSMFWWFSSCFSTGGWTPTKVRSEFQKTRFFGFPTLKKVRKVSGVTHTRQCTV